MQRPAPDKGYTLLEMLIVIVIISILFTLGLPTYAYLRKKMQDTVCMRNLRILHGGFIGYMMDHDMVWPQMPAQYRYSATEKNYYRWWRDTMKEYDIEKEHWICLADSKSNAALEKEGNDDFVGSYVPTEFDELPNTANRWRMPWVVERGENHGSSYGPNTLMPDGTIVKGISVAEMK